MSKLFAALAFFAFVPSSAECATIGSRESAVGGGSVGNGSVGGLPSSSEVDCGDPPSTNLVYWFDGDSVNGSDNAGLTHGDAISTWENLAPGGSAKDATNGGGTQRPAFLDGAINGHDALSFDGQGDQFTISDATTTWASLTASRRAHVIAVVRMDSAPISGYNYWLASTTGTGTSGPMIGINSNRTSFNYVIGTSPTYTGHDPGPTWTLGAWHGYEMRLDNSTIKVKLDGAAEASTALTFTTEAALDANPAIGCNPGGTTACANVAIAFLALYTDSMGTDDRAAMKEFVTCRYGIDLY